jgi:hypothetical protein
MKKLSIAIAAVILGFGFAASTVQAGWVGNDGDICRNLN